MKKVWADVFSFVGGVVVNREMLFFLAASDEAAKKKLRFSQFLVWKAGVWLEAGNQDWLSAGVTFDDSASPMVLAVGEFGETYLRGGGMQVIDVIKVSGPPPADRGPLRCVRSVGDKVFVAGMDRQIYMRTKKHWTELSSGFPSNLKSKKIVGFESIDGFDEKDLYAVGWDGEIWNYSGNNWTQCESPTSLILTDVCCAGDKNVYAVGQKGTVICGRGDAWKIVEGLEVEDDLWSVVWFGKKLYMATTSELLVYDGKRISAVNFGDDEPETFYDLAVGDGVLCSIGAKDVMLFDGKKWRRLE